MCDFSLQSTQSRPAKIGDKLTTRNFGTGTRGFAAPEDPRTAVCLLPGTELAFSKEVALTIAGMVTASALTSLRPWQSFGKSTRKSRGRIMMRLSFQMGAQSC